MLHPQSCLTLCNSTECSPPGSFVHGIFQARLLEWVAMPSSRGSSPSRDGTSVSCISCIARGFFTTEPPGKLARKRQTQKQPFLLLSSSFTDALKAHWTPLNCWRRTVGPTHFLAPSANLSQRRSKMLNSLKQKVFFFSAFSYLPLGIVFIPVNLFYLAD